MTITSAGYDGSLAEADFAKINGENGQPYGRPAGINDFQPTITSGQPTPTVAIAAGSMTGWGVRATSDATASFTFSPPVSGVRYDTVVLRRDWTTNTSSLVKLTGTATRGISASRLVGPGVTDDQPVALVQVTNGSTAVTSLEDLRVWPTKVSRVTSLLAAPVFPGSEAILSDGTRYRCEFVSGSLLWVSYAVKRTTRQSDLDNIAATAVEIIPPSVEVAGNGVKQYRVSATGLLSYLTGPAGDPYNVFLRANGVTFFTKRITMSGAGETFWASDVHTPTTTATTYSVFAQRVAGTSVGRIQAATSNPAVLTVEPIL